MQQRYRYTLEDQISTKGVTPLGASDFTITWSKEQEESERDYAKTFDGNIVFVGEAYNQLLELEQSEYRCVNTLLIIEKFCNGSWKEFFRGRISLNNGDWDLDRCQVKMKFTEEKESTCLTENDGEEINLLTIYPKYELFTRPSNISYEFLDFDDNYSQPEQPAGIQDVWYGSELPEAGQWRVVKHHQNAQLQNAPAEWTVYAKTEWIREVTEVNTGDPAPDGNWTYVGTIAGKDKYARQANLFNYQFREEYPSPNNQIISLEYDYIGKNGAQTKLRNAVKLEDAIQLFVNTFCDGLTVVSDFFQINPENESSINYVTQQASKVRNIFLLQASDVKRPTATGMAQRAMFTWEKLTNALQKMFNVEWRVKNGVLRLEHVSFFTKTLGMDLTEPEYEKWLRGKRKYTYKNESLPSKETWKFGGTQSYGDFEGQPITYNSGCIVNKRTSKTHSIEGVYTDVELAFAFPNSDNNTVAEDGIFFIAGGYDGTNYYILQEDGILSAPKVNNTLAISQLLRDYHKHERPFPTGKMNGEETLFKSVIRTKQGTKITIPYCCPSDFDPEVLIKTDLGDGEINSASFSFAKETMELELLYDAFENLAQNTEPVAVFDTFNVYANSTTNLDVLANDIYRAGDEIVLVDLPAHGTATVVGDQIEYEADPTYTGNVYLSYRIRDGIWGVLSNITTVSINIRAENTPPIANPDSYTLLKDEVLTIAPAQGVLANDTDDYGGLFIADYDATSANGGTVVMGSEGGFEYTPPTGFTGVDEFEYTVEDDGGLQTIGQVTINVQEANMPITVPDNYVARNSSTLNVDGSYGRPALTANDYSLGGHPINAIPETKATSNGGTVQIFANGQFEYLAPATIGNDTFNYSAIISGGGTAIGTATVKVIPTVKVEIETVSIDTEFSSIWCGEDEHTEAIRRDTANVILKFYGADDQPIDTTGMGLNVKIKRIRNNELNSETYTSIINVTATGTQMTALENEYTYERERDCDNELILRYNQEFELEPDSNYLIV